MRKKKGYDTSPYTLENNKGRTRQKLTSLKEKGYLFWGKKAEGGATCWKRRGCLRYKIQRKVKTEA